MKSEPFKLIAATLIFVSFFFAFGYAFSMLLDSLAMNP